MVLPNYDYDGDDDVLGRVLDGFYHLLEPRLALLNLGLKYLLLVSLT
jgi:hypothetical protein